MYQLTGVSKIYQKGRRTVTAVRDLDLVIGDGEWLAVQGRTGHGKTTLLQLLGGLDRPTSGIVDFDGAGPGPAARGPGHPGAGGLDRLHLPDLQPGADAVGGRERRGRADPARHPAGRSAAAG